LALLKIYWGEGGSTKLMNDLRVLIYPMVYQAILTVVLALALPVIFITVHLGGLEFQSFLGIFNFHSSSNSELSLVRPNGFFWEPGVFQIYLNLLLFILFINRASWMQILPTLLGLALTQSTAGIVIAAIQLVYFAIVPFLTLKIGLVNILRLAMIAIVIVPIGVLMQENVQSKLSGVHVGSTNARYYDLVSGLLVLREHPVLGIGFNHLVYRDLSIELNPDTELLSKENQNGRDNTNGLVMILYSVGLPLGLFYLLGMVRQKLMPHKIMFALILLFSMGSEPLAFTPFFALFFFSGLTLKKAS